MRLLVTCFRTAQGRTLFMEGTRPSTVNSIGMFDMLKGVGMITIVLAHTARTAPAICAPSCGVISKRGNLISCTTVTVQAPVHSMT